MKILNTVILISSIDCEWYAIEALAANNTAKTSRMIWFTGGPQYSFQNRFHTHRALFKRVQIVFLATWLPVQSVKWFTLQIDLTLAACKASNVINLLHSCTAGTFANHSFAALHTNAYFKHIQLKLIHFPNIKE